MKTELTLLSITMTMALALTGSPSLANHPDKDAPKGDTGAVQVAFKGSDVSTDRAQPTEPFKKQKHEKSKLDIPYTADFFVTAY